MFNVLVIDDDVLMRSIYRKVLENDGYCVTSANDGEEGVVCALAAPPDLIITDMSMPRKSGIQVVKEVLEHHRLLPIIVISGESKQTLQSCLDAGARAVLSKPFRMSELRNKISEVLQSRPQLDAKALAVPPPSAWSRH